MINWTTTPRFDPLQGLLAQAPYGGSPVEVYRQTRGLLGSLPGPYQSQSRAIEEQARKERIDPLLNTGSPSDGGGIDNYSPAPMGGGPMNFQQMSMARLGGNMLAPGLGTAIGTASLMNQGVPLGSALANQMGFLSNSGAVAAALNNSGTDVLSGIGIGDNFHGGYGNYGHSLADNDSLSATAGWGSYGGDFGGFSGDMGGDFGFGGDTLGGGSLSDNDGQEGGMW